MTLLDSGPICGLPEQKRPDPLRLISYQEYRDSLQVGDIGLVAGDDAICLAIQRITNSPYSHWMMFGWVCAGRVAALSESTSPRSHTVPLSARVKERSGHIDVYRLRPEIARLVDLEQAWEFMFRAGDQDYPDAMLAHDWWKILTGHGTCVPNCDEPDGQRRVCSQLGHAALRVAGMPVMESSDCDVYPRHGAYPTWTQYVATLVLE